MTPNQWEAFPEFRTEPSRGAFGLDGGVWDGADGAECFQFMSIVRAVE